MNWATRLHSFRHGWVAFWMVAAVNFATPHSSASDDPLFIERVINVLAFLCLLPILGAFFHGPGVDCERCPAANPPKPDGWRMWGMGLCHVTERRPLFPTVVFAVTIGGAVFTNEIPYPFTWLFLPAALFLTLHDWAFVQHNSFGPFCPWCDDDDDGGGYVDMPEPDPSLTTSKD